MFPAVGVILPPFLSWKEGELVTAVCGHYYHCADSIIGNARLLSVVTVAAVSTRSYIYNVTWECVSTFTV